MSREQKTTIRYSIGFKHKVVREIEEEGITVSAAKRRYGISGGQTIQKWLCNFGKASLLNKIVRVEMRDEKDRIKELEAEVQKLKLALADATVAKGALESLIEVVNEHYHTDVKKNLGTRRSNEPRSKKGSR